MNQQIKDLLYNLLNLAKTLKSLLKKDFTKSKIIINITFFNIKF
ncbi:hypothetical protein TVCOMph1_CDS0032 [Terrisporobacter phage TVCOM_ph1]